MPTYVFRNTKTEEYHEEFMSMNDVDQYLKDNPDLVQELTAPSIVSGVAGKKPDSSFRDILKNVKREHSRGFTKSTVNTW